MIKLQIASIPCRPNTLRKSCPMGNERSVSRRSVTDVVAYEAAISRSQPKALVAPTETRMAIGAERAAPAVSSDM